MNREKMLYHANEKGVLNFEVRSMKGETRDNLQFLLDGGYLERDPNSVFAGGSNDVWQEFIITGDGKILLAVYRLEFAHQNGDDEKFQNRAQKLNELLDEHNRTIQYFEPSLTKKQKKAVNHMLNSTTKSEPTEVTKLVSVLKSNQNNIPKNSNNLLDKIDLDELSLQSMFNMSVGLGQRGTDSTRHEDYVMKKCAEELGELSLEINISQGLSYKEPGKDGIKGEAVDLAICALDMFALQCPNMTSEEIEREFLSYMLTKLNKWKKTLQ